MNIVTKIRRLMTPPIVVVSGLPRSGTSLAMSMLEAGGLEPFIDTIRQPDEDNPKGYFEYEQVKKLHEQSDKRWLRQARGKAIKVVSYLLRYLPPENRYQVLFMNRHLDEIIASQNKMLRRRGEDLKQPDKEMKQHFAAHLRETRFWISRQDHFRLLDLDFATVVASPLSEARRIEQFLQEPLDISKMATRVDLSLYRNRARI